MDTFWFDFFYINSVYFIVISGDGAPVALRL